MDQLIIFALLLAAAVVAILYFVSSQMRSMKEELTKNNGGKEVMFEWLKEMRGSVEKSGESVERQLKDQTKLIWERLDNASKVIGEVQKQIGGIEKFGRDVEDLANVLKSPKLRGGLGEQMLYEILENYLPKEMYATQHKFRGGDVCDAVIFLDKGTIPIDSKFSMENFKLMVEAENDAAKDRAKKEFIKDVKKRIDEIASKYILPDEGTTDWAVMYIPSENSFYELTVNTPEIRDYAQNKNVFLTSPNTFSYFVKTVMVAYRQNELAKHAGEIMRSLSGIRVEAEKFEEDLGVLDRHVTNSYKSIDNVKLKFGRLFSKIEAAQIPEGNLESEPPQLVN